MIYSYEEVENLGPYGNTLGFVDTEDSGLIKLGEVDGRIFIYLPDEITPISQDKKIKFKKESELTPDIINSLRQQKLVQLKKDQLRNKIELEVGDIYDLIADAMKLIEFNAILTSRLAADYLGTQLMDPEVKQVYAQRNQEFLSMVDENTITIRGSFDNPDEMMMRVLARYSKIQELVRDNYSEYLDELGL